MYIHKEGTNDCRYLSPDEPWSETGVSMPAGEMVFYVIYKMKFYGTKTFDSPYSKSYQPVFGNHFYELA